MDIPMLTSTSPQGAADRDEPCCGGEAVAPTLDPARTETLADRLKALADPTRLRMLDLLAAQAHPICVCDITSQFPQNQPTISHHLRILREAGFIMGEKRGVWAYYDATDEGRRAVSVAKALV
jgi:ArsR family transcriptional regulator, arsenate/arsenite/antimonite-responsive transcriptional repressor